MSDTARPDVTSPDIIRAYQDAHDRHDITTALAAFTTDATVTDEGQHHHGTAAIRGWLAKTSAQYQYTRTLVSAENTGQGTWLIRNRLEGNFPGNVVDLRYQFTITGSLISRLVIEP